MARFEEANIPGFCAIAAQKHERNGKWSNTTYTLELAPGVRAMEMLSPLHGTWGDNLPSWGAVAQELGLPVAVAQEIVRAEYPDTARRLDDLESFAAEVEESGTGIETVIISFGSPTLRQMAEGWWCAPKCAQTSEGREVRVVPDGAWGAPKIVSPTPEGAKLISARHTPGMHGGYWAIEVAVPIKIKEVT